MDPVRLRILVVANQLLGWSQNFITRELVALCKLGVDLRVASRSIDEREDLSDEETMLAEQALMLPENPFLPGPLARHLRFALSSPTAYREAWRHFLRFRHDRVQARLRSLACLFRAAAVARQVCSFDPDLIHAHFLTAPAETSLYLSSMCRLPWSVTAHAMDIYRDHSGNEYKIEDALFVTTCTQANQRYLAAEFRGAASKIRRIYHGLEFSDDHDGEIRDPSTPFLFLAVGRMVPKKGFGYLLTACSLVRQRTDLPFRCRIVGDGDLLDAFRDRVKVESLDDVVDLSGRARVTEMANHYSSASALVVPSVVTADGDRDGIPNVCLEAMSYRLPIIASDISGLPEVVEPGINGILVAPEDPEALATAMLEILTHGDSSKLGRESRRIVTENFDVRTNVRIFLDTAEKFLGRA